MLEISAVLFTWILQFEPQTFSSAKVAMRVPEEDTVPVVGFVDAEFSVTPL